MLFSNFICCLAELFNEQIGNQTVINYLAKSEDINASVVTHYSKHIESFFWYHNSSPPIPFSYFTRHMVRIPRKIVASLWLVISMLVKS